MKITRTRLVRRALQCTGAAVTALSLLLFAPQAAGGAASLLDTAVFGERALPTAPLPADFDPPALLLRDLSPSADRFAAPAADSVGSSPVADASLVIPGGFCNMTSLSPDLEAIGAAWESARAAEAPTAPGREPLVLILHTHSSEAFSPDGVSTVSDPDRHVSDITETTVAVGEVVANRLAERGVPVLHCTRRIDDPDFQAAYTVEKQVILEYLAAYPSIRYIFDIHRDDIRRDGTLIRSRTTVGGIPVAPIMFVVGSNEKGAAHPDWEKNLGYALHLSAAIEAKYPGVMRGINLRSASFNEQYTPHSLLVEIGTAAGSLREAKAAGILFADAVADEILRTDS